MKKVLLVVLLVLSMITIYVIHIVKQNETEKHLSDITKQYFRAYEKSYYEKNKIAKILFSGLLKMGKIEERLYMLQSASLKEKNKIRNDMFKDLEYRYNTLKLIGLKQFHIHLPNNESFLRVHNPEKFGDDLTIMRPTVTYVNKEHLEVNSFEEGRYSYGVRFVFPISHKNIHVGSMEISFSASSITKDIMKSYYVLSNFFIRKEVVDRKNSKESRNKYGLSHHEGFYHAKDVLKELKKVSRKDMSKLKPDKAITKKIRMLGMGNTPSSIYDEQINAIFTVIPIINSITNEHIAFLTIRSVDRYINPTNKKFNMILYGSLGLLVVAFYLLYVMLTRKKYLEREVNIKTKELKDMNETLEQKILERTKEQNSLLSLFDVSDINLFKCRNDEHWNIEYVSNSIENIFGYTKEDFLGFKIRFDEIIHKDDIQRVKKELGNSMQGNLDYFIHKPYRIVKKNKEVIWISDTTSFLKDEDGNIEYFLFYIQDVTKDMNNKNDLLEANKKFKLIVDVSKDGLWDWNPITNEVYFEKRWKTMLGYEEDEIKSTLDEWRSRVHPDDINQAFDDVNAHLEGKTSFYENIHRMKHKDDRWLWILDRGKALFDENNKAYRFIGFHRDITLQKEYELNLENLVQEKTLENLNQLNIMEEQSKMASMGEMIGAIAHQWRQPLNAIGISIQNLEYDYEDGVVDKEFLDKFIEKNKKTINFMSKTIDDFRDFFRIGKKKELFCIKKAIEDTISIQSAQLKSYEISLSIEGDNFSVNGYKTEFMQVILNLINNAKDEILEKKGSSSNIEITLDKSKKSIFIKNYAGQIPKEIVDRVFEPYFTTKEQGKGTGMGLYISKMIIEKNMNGKLSVQNIDNGALFTITF